MKNAAKLVLKGLFVIVLFTSSTVGLSSIGVKSVSEAKAAVSYQQVYQYLVNHGYTVISLRETPLQGDENWNSHTMYNGVEYLTSVYVSKGEIIGVGDMPF